MWSWLGNLGSWAANNAGTISNYAQLGAGIYGAAKQGKAGKKAGRRAAAMATPIGYGTAGPWGATAVDPRSRMVTYSPAQNPFSQLFNVGGLGSLANAYSAPGAAYYGASPEVAAAAQGMFGPALEQEAAGRLGVLRELAQPQEQQMQNQLTDRLFASGRLGGTGGAIEQQAQAEALRRADLERTLASQDWAQNRAMNRFSTALQAVGSGQQGQRQQFDIGTNSAAGIANIFQQLMAQGGYGIAAGQGSATPGNVAMGAANAGANSNMAMWNAFADWANTSGAFDKLGSWLGNQGTPATPSAPATSQPGPWSGGYIMPTDPASKPYMPTQY